MLSTDTTWEVVQSFLNVPGLKGVALIDGRSRPYFQGIERVLNSQQREALAQGVWQVLETIPDDFESFEFQFAGTQVYIHKLSQNQILLVLTHDNLIYPDYFDAFTQLREKFNQDSGTTLEAFQRLLGSRNTKVTPLNLSDVANAPDNSPAPSNSHPVTSSPAKQSFSRPLGRPATPSTQHTEAISPPLPSGSADYAVAQDIGSAGESPESIAPDAPANPATADPATQAGLGQELSSDNDSGLSDASSRTSDDSNGELAALMDTLSLGEDDFASPTTPPSLKHVGANSEESALQDSTPQRTPESSALEAAPASEPEIQLPNMAADASSGLEGLTGSREGNTETFSLPDMGEPSPWDTPADVADLVQEAVQESNALKQVAAQNEISASATDVAGAVTGESGSPKSSEQSQTTLLQESAAPELDPTAADEDSYLSNRLDAIALDEDIEIDELFGSGAKDEAAVDSSDAGSANGAMTLPVLEAYVDALNGLGEFSAHYLGRAVIVNYWRTSRTSDDWLKGAFAIERSANSLRLSPDYAASRQSPITPGQQAALQAWSEKFIIRCGKVIRDFPQLAQQALPEEQVRLLDL